MEGDPVMRYLMTFIFILAVLLPTQTFYAGIFRMLPPNGSITDEKIADYGIESPIVFDRGFVPDTPTVWICFDDGWNKGLYDSILAWQEAYGFQFCIGMIVSTRNTDDHFTDAELRDLYAHGHEILSHAYSNVGGTGTENNRPSYFGDDRLYRIIVDSKKCLEDTVGVKVYGFNWPAGDWNDRAWTMVAEYYDYSTGGYPRQQSAYNQADSSWDYTVSNLYRHVSTRVGEFDSIRVNTADGNYYFAHNQTYWDYLIIRPGAALNQFHLPVLGSNGPGSWDEGTVRTLDEAKIAISLIQHCNGAGGLFFHKLETATWLDSLMFWLYQQQQAGRIRVRTSKWVYENYVLKPLKPGANLYPYPHFASVRPWDPPQVLNFTGDWPVMAMTCLTSGATLYGYANGLKVEMDSTGTDGFDGNSYCMRLYTSVYPRRITFGPFVVPPMSTVYASVKFNNYGCFTTTDTSEVGIWIDPVYGNINKEIVLSNGLFRETTEMGNGVWAMDEGGDAATTQFMTSTAYRASQMGGATVNYTNCPMQIRRTASDDDMWIECRDWRIAPTGIFFVTLYIGDLTLSGASWVSSTNSEYWTRFDDFVISHIPPLSVGVYGGR